VLGREFLYALDRPPLGGTISGYVRTLWEGLEPGAAEPEPGITRVTLSGMGVQRNVDVRDGEFEFGGLPPGTYKVAVARPQGMKKSPPHAVKLPTSRSCEHLFIHNVPEANSRGRRD
jgi:hypothetical protein